MEQEYKNRVEAILFTVGRFISLEELQSMTEIGSPGLIKECLEELQKDYDSRESSLQIISEGNKWKLSIKREYLYLTEKLLSSSELDNPTQETLAVIAYKNPALQSEIIKIRGNGAYDHIKILKDIGFVTSEKSGRTKLLKLTQKFYDYFDIVENKLNFKLEKNEQETN